MECDADGDAELHGKPDRCPEWHDEAGYPQDQHLPGADGQIQQLDSSDQRGKRRQRELTHDGGGALDAPPLNLEAII